MQPLHAIRLVETVDQELHDLHAHETVTNEVGVRESTTAEQLDDRIGVTNHRARREPGSFA